MMMWKINVTIYHGQQHRDTRNMAQPIDFYVHSDDTALSDKTKLLFRYLLIVLSSAA